MNSSSGRGFGMAVILAIVLGGGGARGDDLQTLQGAWQGRDPLGNGVSLVIRGHHVTQTVSGRGGASTSEYDITLDESTEPRQIDYSNVGSKDLNEEAAKDPNTRVHETTPRGIYKIDGPKLVICIDLLGKQRPTQFVEDKKKGGGLLVTYSRPKAAAAKPSGPSSAERMEGVWSGAIGFGKDRRDVRLVLVGNVATLTTAEVDDPQVLARSDFQLDESAKPARIEFRPQDGVPRLPLLSGKAAFLLSKDGSGLALYRRTDGEWPKNLAAKDKQESVQFLRAKEPAESGTSAAAAETEVTPKKATKTRRPTAKGPSSRPRPR